MLTRDTVARLPKVELHVHLDGSLRPQTMLDLAREAGIALPTEDPEALRRFMHVQDAHDLEEYLRRFDYTIGLLQTPEAIERVAYEMVADAAADNVRYLEVRYCPWLSTRGGLALEEIITAEAAGLARGAAEFGVRTGIINCSLRHYDPAQSVAIAKASVACRDHGVLGFDLAGGEAGRPPGRHREAFEIARRGYLGITVHAGEAAGAESIAEAIFLCQADRLGHGTRLREDPELLAYVRDRRILVEINVTSNLLTRAVATAAEHPVRAYYDQGLAVSLCTDGWLMSNVTLTDEFWLAHTALGFGREELDQMILYGCDGGFLPWPERCALRAELELELAAIP